MNAFVSLPIEAASEDAAREYLHANRCTDGLPVVPPTPERVERMLEVAVMAGLDPDIVLGAVGPNMGEATVEKVAINAVMAGCLPDHFPVVVAAMTAICDPRLDISEVQVTTHQLTPMLIVNGPARIACGVASGFGALGYGHRANLTIGRAVRLCMINLGGGWPGVSDMAILGQPAMISYCLAEDEESSPFAPLHTTFGFDAGQSAVTAICTCAPQSVIALPDADDASAPERLLTALALSLANVGNTSAISGKGHVVVVLNPDHAAQLHRAGFGRTEIQRSLFERSGNPADFISRLRTGRPAADPGAFQHALQAPDAIHILVAGGPGLYSTVMSAWGGGAHGNIPVTKEIVLSDACELPGAPVVRA
jgi:hypothetical protein